MVFFNPNVVAEMTEILKNYQEKYVPCFGTGGEQTVLTNTPVHGDQQIEERARNVQRTFRDGADKYQRLETLPPEHADWHAKVTLFKVGCQHDAETEEIWVFRIIPNTDDLGSHSPSKSVRVYESVYKICGCFHSSCRLNPPCLSKTSPQQMYIGTTRASMSARICRRLGM